LKIGERQAATNRCGRFVVRDLPAAGVVLQVKALGFRSVTIPLEGLVEGQELGIPPIVLERNP
ncbi:MAG TPA: hypothetical protein VN203_22575, partial [Candidatus Acidoferrum sp.]|nr:hypothetical protein [Candidatus Acidoferrum sp.]